MLSPVTYALTFLDDEGRVAWMGAIDCATNVRAMASAAQTLRERPRYAAVEISDKARLVKRMTRAEVRDHFEEAAR